MPKSTTDCNLARLQEQRILYCHFGVLHGWLETDVSSISECLLQFFICASMANYIQECGSPSTSVIVKKTLQNSVKVSEVTLACNQSEGASVSDIFLQHAVSVNSQGSPRLQPHAQFERLSRKCWNDAGTASSQVPSIGHLPYCFRGCTVSECLNQAQMTWPRSLFKCKPTG